MEGGLAFRRQSPHARLCNWVQELRTTLDQKMMHNVNTAVQQADALLVIVDATSNLAEVADMPGMAPGWTGPPAALVRPCFENAVSNSPKSKQAATCL